MFKQVAKDTTPFGILQVSVRGRGTVTLRQLMDEPQITLLLSSLSMDATVFSAGAVMGSSKRQRLIHVGNSVEFSCVPGEVRAQCVVFYISSYLTLLG